MKPLTGKDYKGMQKIKIIDSFNIVLYNSIKNLSNQSKIMFPYPQQYLKCE